MKTLGSELGSYSIVISPPTPTLPEPTPRLSTEPAGSSTLAGRAPPVSVVLPPLLALNAPRCPEATALLANALLLTTLNDEQRSDDLPNPSPHQTTCPNIGSRENTNLSRREDGYEEIHNGVSVSAHRPKNQQRARRVKGTRLDEHGDDGLGQTVDPSCPQGGASVPSESDDPEDDYEGEEDVE